MSSIPQDWRKKIFVEQIRVSVSLGRMQEAKSLLTQLQQLEPDNERISKELDRLERGVRLQIVTDSSDNPYECQLANSEEAARAREEHAKPAPTLIQKARPISEDAPQRVMTKAIKFKEPAQPHKAHQQSEEEKTKARISKMMQLYQKNKDGARHLDRKKLRQHQRFLDSCLKDKPYAWSIAEREGMSDVLRLIFLELKRRNREKAIIIAISCLLVMLAIIGLCAGLILDSAKRADIKVQYALIHEDKAELIYQLEEADRPVYLLLYPQLKLSMEQGRQWLSQLDQSQELILQITEGKRDIQSLTQDELKALRNLEAATDEKSIALIQKLNKFKAEKLSQQEQAKLRLLNDIAQDVPAPSPLLNEPASDKKRLLAEAEALTKAFEHFKSTQFIHGKKDDYMDEVSQRQKEIQVMLQAIAQLEQCLQSIDSCPSYPEHVDLLRRLKYNPYPLAQDLFEQAEHLPSLEEINKMMRYGSNSENQETLKKAERIFLGDEPSFSADNPATAQQIDALDQIFRARAFYTPLYQVIASYEGKVWLSESLPIMEQDGGMRLTTSKLDPSSQLGDSMNIKLPVSAGLVLHQFNTLGLIKATDMNRNDFFRKAKILDVLTTILQYQDANCPTLAQAFIFQQVIKMIELHPQPALMGLLFSEQLRDDIKSFKATVAQSGIKLSSQNWLIINPSNKKAEMLLTDWFKQHRQHHYSTDCKRRLRDILFTEVRYAGYVNAGGQAVLHRDLKADTPLWYLDQGSKKVCVGTLKQVPQALPYSPLLYSAAK